MTEGQGRGPDHRVIENQWILLQDGRRLAARIWLPGDAEAQPVPAILEYLPYRKRDGTAPRDETNYPVFAAAGYAGVRVDIAGTGDSDGHLADEYLADELASGAEVIAWIAAQPWCSGAVGMIGISWGGFNGLQIAMRRPPALKAIVTVCSTVDRYADDIHFMGGGLLNDNFNWGAQMTAYSTRPPDPALRDDWREVWLERLERLPFLAPLWLRRTRRDEYWKHGSVCEDWDAIGCAVLAIGGWADAYSDAPARLVEKLSATAKALVGPWEHKYPHIARIEPRADFHGEVIGWFDRWLKGEENGAEALPDYRAYVQEHGAPCPNFDPQPGRWVGEKVWPSQNVTPMTLHLAAGSLGEARGSGTADVASPQHLGDAAGYFCPGMRIENELADDQSRDDALSLCFDSAPLEAPLEILGAPVFEFDFSVDRPQALLAVRLCDLAPDGVSERVSYQPFNLTHRESHESPEALEPGRRYRLRIPLKHCGHRFRAGHRLRLALSTAYWPIVWPSPEAAQVTLHLENCRLILPRRQAQDPEPGVAPPPPRPFPNLPAEVLRGADSHTAREALPDGTRVLRTFDDFGESRDPTHGLESGSWVEQLFSIHPDDPLSARVETRWTYSFRRGDWRTRIESENAMTSTAQAFRLTRRVKAYEGEGLVFDKTWEEEVPRDCL